MNEISKVLVLVYRGSKNCSHDLSGFYSILALIVGRVKYEMKADKKLKKRIQNFVSLSGMVETPRLQAKQVFIVAERLVIPATEPESKG